MDRLSVKDIKHMIRDIQYPGVLPDELKPYHVYLTDSGHNILCVPKEYADKVQGEPWDYEAPVPVKYVIEKGYEIKVGYIVVDVPYDKDLGIVTDEKYDEY